MGSLSNLYISQSYQSLIHLATNNTASATLIGLQDGLGNSIGVSINTAGDLYLSGSLTASLQQGYAWVGNASNVSALVPTSSFGGALPAGTISSSAQITGLGFVSSSVTASSLITASFSGNTLTFTKGNGTTFGVIIPDISGSTIPAGTISGSSQITALGFVSSSITASSLVTASFSGNTLTFTKGDSSTFGVVIPDISGSGVPTGTVSSSAQILAYNIFATTGSNTFIGNQTINGNVNITGSLTASGLFYPTTAGIAGQFITTNGTNTLSFDDVHAILEDVRYGENITISDPLYVSGSNGTRPIVYKADAAIASKMPVIYVATSTAVANTNTTALTLGLITGVTTTGYPAGTIIYVAEGSAGWSASRPSGSASIVQSLGIVTKEGPGGSGRGLVLNPGPATLPNIETGYAWVGNGGNQPVAVPTSSFLDAIPLTSLNAFTASQDTKNLTLASVTSSLNSATASLFTSASLALVTASVSLNTITFTKGDTTTFNITVNTGSGGGGSAISVQDEGTILGDVTSFNFTGAGVTATLSAGTASITIPGGGGSIDTGSFATTGSNVFTGDQTLIDNAGNFFTISDVSGSMLLVAKGFTSASAHMSSSVASPSGSFVNLIFKNNNFTSDTIISGSNNIFTNLSAPTAGFKRYIGGNNNIYNGTLAAQISSSMAFSPAMNTNLGPGTVIMRGPVSSSTYTISSNLIQGTINIGSSAVSNAEKLVSGLTMTGNSVIGNLSITANKEFLSASMTVNNNTIGGTVTLNAASSSISFFSNNIVADNAFTFTNNYYTGSVGSVGPQANRNFIIGTSNTFLATGVADLGGTLNYVNNVIGGGSNTIFVNATSASTSAQFYNSIVYGNTLIVSASSNSSTTNGSAFFGRYNSNDSRRNSTAGTIFAVGTGTSTGARKTGFLIDSGSNTFVEGTFNVSGSSTFTGSVIVTGSLFVNGISAVIPVGTVSSSTQIVAYGIFATTGSNTFNGNQRITGSLTISGSIITVDRSGNDGNTYMGQNALGMGTAGAQPLAVGNSISVAIGQGAMRFASGSNQNVAIGNNALLITSGSKNFAMGSEALSGNTTGASNIAIGTSALQNNKTGDSSTAIGDSAAQFASGSQNTFIGQYAGYNVTGSNNVIIGSYRGVAGEKIDNNIILSDGQQNIKAQYSGSAWSLQDGIKLNKGSNKTTDIVSVNSTLTVSNSLVTATSIILVTTQNSTTGPVYPAVITSKGAGTFDIAHNFGGSLDVAYFIINPT
jgi:hypothetical protein